MNIKVQRIELSGIERELSRIANLLEAIYLRDIAPQAMPEDFPEEANVVRAFYNDERQEIIAEKLRAMGKEPKNEP